MASSSSSKTSCATEDCKRIGILKCEGCQRIFCAPHVAEHRNVLGLHLDEIVLEYDTLQQTLAESEDKIDHHPLLQEIDRWEKQSIEKIRQTAYQARQQLNSSTTSSKGTLLKEVQALGEQLSKARVDDDYVETDLQMWTKKLEQLKRGVATDSPMIHIYEDSTKALINRIYVSTTKLTLTSEEGFEEFYGNIRIENNGSTALYDNRCIGANAYVRRKTKYTTGKHQIRFRMSKENTGYLMSFYVVPTVFVMSKRRSNETPCQYGWNTNDSLNIPSSENHPKKNFNDFRGEKTLELQLTIDCDNHKISYFNERTQKTHQINVNTTLCPLPWQLEFYLFNPGDRVELLF